MLALASLAPSFLSGQHHSKYSLMSFDRKIPHAGFPCHTPQLGDCKSGAEGLWSVMTDDRAAHQRPREQLRCPDCGPGPLQVIDDVADSRDFIHASQNGDC